MNGVVAYIEEMEDGKLKLVFDDVCSEEQPPKNWHRKVLFTSTPYESKAMRDLNMPKAQYEQIGENLVIRLLALNGKIK